MDRDRNAQDPGAPGIAPGWRGWLRAKQSLVPTIAVVTVVVAAVATTLMVTYGGGEGSRRPPAVPQAGQGVVRAPPLVVQAPPLKPPAASGAKAQGQGVAANALGGAPACRNCGVVESVTPVNGNRSFLVRIRMDDGTVRTVEQRVAVAPGSHVLLQGTSVQTIPAAPRQG